MDPEGFDRLLSRCIGDDPTLAALFATLGPRVSRSGGEAYEGEDHVAPLGVVVDRPMRAHVRMEAHGAPERLQAMRLSLALAPGVGSVNRRFAAAAWLPVLDVLPGDGGRWVASRRFGMWSTAPGNLLGYQGSWQSGPGPGTADSLTRIIVRAQHARGAVLWVGSRTSNDTPGDLHKHSLVVLGEAEG
jgi:hypothetical protein